MHAHGVKVLDGADDDRVAGLVAHDFHLIFFPADQGFFYQNFALKRGFQARSGYLQKLFFIMGDAAAGAAQGEGRPYYQGPGADLFGDRFNFQEIVGAAALRHVEVKFLHGLFKEIPVLRAVDGLVIGADHFNFVFFKDAGPGQFHGQVQSGLSA